MKLSMTKAKAIKFTKRPKEIFKWHIQVVPNYMTDFTIEYNKALTPPRPQKKNCIYNQDT